MSTGLHISCPPNHDKKKCAYCKKLVFLDDPITLCSDCRSVYHRKCWNDLGSDCISDECRGLVEPEQTTVAVGAPTSSAVAPVVPNVAGGTMSKLMALVRQEHIVLWASLICTVLGFYLLQSNVLIAAGASLAGLIFALLVWADSALSDEGVPLSEAGRRIHKAVLIGCSAVLLSSVIGGAMELLAGLVNKAAR